MFQKFKKFSEELVQNGFTAPVVDSSNPFAILKVTFKKEVDDKTLCVTLNQEGFVIKDTDLIGIGYFKDGKYVKVDTLEGISDGNDITTKEIVDMLMSIV